MKSVEELLNKNKLEVKNIKYTIIKTKDKDNCVVLYLDNNEKLNVSIENYFKYKDLKGFDDNIYNLLKDDEKFLLAYNSVLRKLSNKDYSKKQIIEYLIKNRCLSNSEAMIIVDKLIKYDLINDDRFVQSKINYLSNSNSYRKIRNKLLKDGISEELIDQYLLINENEEENKANLLANKYLSSIKNKSINLTKSYIFNKLVSNGFSIETSKNVVNSLIIKGDNELELLNKEYNKALNKYSKKYSDYELRNKIYSYLISKGFNSNDIKEVINLWNK